MFSVWGLGRLPIGSTSRILLGLSVLYKAPSSSSLAVWLILQSMTRFAG